MPTATRTSHLRQISKMTREMLVSELEALSDTLDSILTVHEKTILRVLMEVK